MSRLLRITQIGSAIGRKKDQAATLKALGLGKRHKSRVVPDTPSVRGRIDKVRHLLRVEELEGEEERDHATE